MLQQVGQAAHDGQAQTEARIIAASLRLPAVELLEHQRQVLRADALPAVDDTQFHLHRRAVWTAAGVASPRSDQHAAARGVAQCVAQQLSLIHI